MLSKRLFVAIVTGMVCLASACLRAEVGVAGSMGAEQPHRPRVGLVLSGGGARGAAHVGVLKVLERLHVPVDAIAGTSMGAVVGGLYASGLSAGEIETLLASIDWQDAFHDRPPRATLNFRRKQDDRQFQVRAPLGLRGGVLRLPRGLIQGQKLTQLLRDATLGVADLASFDRLPIPFRALATDITTGEPVVFSSGSLVTAVRASMAAPGVFAPVDVSGRLLVDGGLSENLPVALAREMGVDVIIAVDVGSPLKTEQQLDSALSVSNQMIMILMDHATARSRALLSPADIVVTPELGNLSSIDFSRVRQAIADGESAATRAESRLAALSVSAVDHQIFMARGQPRIPPVMVDFVRVNEDSERYRLFVEAALAPVVGQPATATVISPAMRSLYGRDLFESLDYRLLQDGDRTGLEVAARRKSWGPNYLRFGLDLHDDFQGNANFTAGMRLVVTEVNPYMAEWNFDLKVGDQPSFAAEFHQPLGYASPWFIAPRFNFGSHSVPVRDVTRLIGDYRVREADFGIDFGRELGDWGEIRAGLKHVTGSTRLRVGVPAVDLPAETSFRQGGWYVRMSVDRLDSVNFPRHGELFVLQWDAHRAALGGDHNADTAQFDWLVARSKGRNTLLAWTSAGSSVSGVSGVQNYFPLGGFLALSGVPTGTLAGPHFGMARLIYLRKIGKGGEGLFDVPTYIGVATELGNVWQRRGDASFRSARKDEAAFLGLDTALGPVYLGAGYDQTGSTSYYLSLGRSF